MFLKHLALFLCLCICPISWAQVSTSDLAKNPQWLALVQYKPNWFGGHTGRGKTTDFYLSPKGVQDPKAELEALQQALLTLKDYKGDPDQHGRCRFPARSKWLATQLHIEIPPENWCPKYSTWKNRIRAQSLTIVFSSYYLNSPSSTYGHTLLRLNRRALNEVKEDSEGLQLLDYGFNYGANPSTTNPIIYAFSGMTGLMPGSFLALPYFYKVREYNDYEVRDLWEYELKLTPQEVDKLVDHFWEVAHTQFGYLYVTENCGYHILNLIDVAAPQYNLMSHLRYWVVPGDTIRILNQAGLVNRVQFRPSVRRQFLTREKDLSAKQRQLLGELVKPPYDFTKLAELNPTEQAQVVDAAMDLLDLQHSRDYIDENAPIKKVKSKFLIERSKLPITAPLVIAAPSDEEPHTAHPSGRMGGGGSWREGRDGPTLGYYNFSYRAALHDLADPIKGYLKHSRTEMGHLNLRYDDRAQKLKVQTATILALDSLSPLSQYNDKSIWRLAVGMNRQTDRLCVDCLRSEGTFGMGYALSPHSRLNFYSLLMGKASYSSDYAKLQLAAHAGPLFGSTLQVGKNFNLVLEWQWLHTWQQKKNFNMTTGSVLGRFFISNTWALEASYGVNPFEQNSSASALYYF